MGERPDPRAATGDDQAVRNANLTREASPGKSWIKATYLGYVREEHALLAWRENLVLAGGCQREPVGSSSCRALSGVRSFWISAVPEPANGCREGSLEVGA